MSDSGPKYVEKREPITVDENSDTEMKWYNLFAIRTKMLAAEAAAHEAPVRKRGSPKSRVLKKKTTKKSQPKPDPGTKRQDVPTSDKNVVGIRMIVDSGNIDAASLAGKLYGDDTQPNKDKVYAKIRFWKGKNWLVENTEGEWEVPEKIKKIVKSRQ